MHSVDIESQSVTILCCEPEQSLYDCSQSFHGIKILFSPFLQPISKQIGWLLSNYIKSGDDGMLVLLIGKYQFQLTEAKKM